MSKAEDHIIRRVSVNLNYSGNMEQAEQFLQKVPHHIENGLGAAVRKADGSVFLQNKDVKAEYLEFDLGTINEQFFEYEFRSELEARFREWLMKLQSGGSGLSQVEVTVLRGGRPELLEILLKYGRLPWWAKQPDTLTLAGVFAEVAAEHPERLIKILKKIGGSRSVRRRLGYHLKEEQLEELIDILEPAHSAFIVEYVDKTVQVNKKKPVRKLPEKEFRHLVWDFVLEYLLTKQTTRFNRKEFVKWNLKRIARHYNKSYKDVVHFFGEYAKKMDPVHGADDALPVILAELHSEYQEQQPHGETGEDTGLETIKSILVGKMKRSESDQAAVLAEAWKTALNQQPAELKSMLFTIGKNEPARKRMVRFMENRQLADMVALAEPANKDFIYARHKQTGKLKNQFSEITASHEELLKEGWMFIITYLFEDRGTNFNRKQFLRSLIGQITAHYNLQITDVLQFFRNFSEGEQSGLLPLIDGIAGEYRSRNQPLPSQTGTSEIEETIGLLRTYLGRINEPGYSVHQAKKAARLMVKLSLTRSRELADLFKTAGEWGLAFLTAWKYLKPEEKHQLVVHLAPDRVSGWEELTRELSHAISQSQSLPAGDLVSRVHTAIFKFAILENQGIDEILRHVVSITAAEQKMPPAALVREIKQYYKPAAGKHVVRYLESLTPDDFTQDIHQKLPVQSRAIRLVELAEQQYQNPSETNIQEIENLLITLNKQEITFAALHLYSRDLLQSTLAILPGSQWRRLIQKITPGKNSESFFAVVELFGEILEKTGGEKITAQLRALLLLYLLDARTESDPRTFLSLLYKQFLKETEKWMSQVGEPAYEIASSEEKKKLLQTLREWHTGSDLDQEGSTRDAVPGFPYFRNIIKNIIAGTSVGLDANDIRLLIPYLSKLLRQGDIQIQNEFLKHVRNRKARKVWADFLPGEVIGRVVSLMMTRQEQERIKKWIRFGTEQTGEQDKTFIFSVLLHAAVQLRYRAFSPALVLAEVVRQATENVSEDQKKEVWKTQTAKITAALGNQRPEIAEELEKKKEQFIKNTGREHQEEAGSKQDSGQKKEPESLPPGEPVYTNRAGLVIVALFLPQLFKKLEYIEDKIFKNVELKYRALHLIEYIATGAPKTEEHLLLFHKLLAGIPVNHPVPPPGPLTTEETKTADDMLEAVISNWKGIGKTTVEGLRESFINRQGKLVAVEENWELTVETKVWDVLLDRLPWSISVIKLPWMKQIIHVQWR